MKVLVIHNKYVETGGEDFVFENEIKLLKENGVEVVSYFFSNKCKGKVQSLIKFLMYPFNFISYFKIRKLVERENPNLVHIHNFFFAASPMILWALKKEKKPVVFTIHNFRLICPSTTLYYNGDIYLKSSKPGFNFAIVLDKVYRDSYFLTFWLYFSNYIHFKIGTFGLINKFVFISSFSKAVFENSIYKKYKDKFTLKNNFRESTLESPSCEREDFYIYIGRLTEEKGIITMINAFIGTSSRLIIIGGGNLQKLVESYSFENKNIEYFGFKTQDFIFQYLSKAKALIFPSLWYEGMPMTIIESFSFGTPVIASNLGTMAEMIISGTNGMLFEKGNHVDLREKVEYFSKMEESEYKEIIQNTFSMFQEKYSADKNYQQLIKIYEHAIDN